MHRLIAIALFSSLLLSGLSACTSATDTVISNQTQVLKQDPNNVSALIERGNAYREKGDFTNALADHNKAVELGPSSARAYLGRGMDYLALNQYEKALEDFNRTIGLNPELSEAYARRGEARVWLQTEYQQAIADFDKALAMGYNNPDIHRFRGQSYFRLNQRDEAVKAYLRAAEVIGDPNTLSNTERELKITALNEALDLGLRDAQLYMRRGTLLRVQKRYERAIDDFGEVLKLNSQSADAYEERADAYYSIGQCSRAEQDLRAACRLQNRRLCEAITLGCGTPSPEPTLLP